MNYFCHDCKRACMGEMSTDELLDRCLICEYCGGELSGGLDDKPDDEDSFDV